MDYGSTHIPSNIKSNINLNSPVISPGVIQNAGRRPEIISLPQEQSLQGIFLEEIANEMSIINQFAGLFAGPTPCR